MLGSTVLEENTKFTNFGSEYRVPFSQFLWILFRHSSLCFRRLLVHRVHFISLYGAEWVDFFLSSSIEYSCLANEACVSWWFSSPTVSFIFVIHLQILHMSYSFIQITMLISYIMCRFQVIFYYIWVLFQPVVQVVFERIGRTIDVSFIRRTPHIYKLGHCCASGNTGSPCTGQRNYRERLQSYAIHAIHLEETVMLIMAWRIGQ
jgi:hypothetical protein